MCRVWLPIAEFAPVRKYYEPKCRACKKIRAKAYRQRPDVKKRAAAYSKAYKKTERGAALRKATYKKHRSKPTVRLRRNTLRRAWALQEKQKCVNYKGGACVCCGYSECLAALDFHHLDPAHKEKPGAGAILAHRSFERNMPELDKCILVCNRCHRELHAGHRTYKNEE